MTVAKEASLHRATLLVFYITMVYFIERPSVGRNERRTAKYDSRPHQTSSTLSELTISDYCIFFQQTIKY
jgi:hypothetical protein